MLIAPPQRLALGALDKRGMASGLDSATGSPDAAAMANVPDRAIGGTAFGTAQTDLPFLGSYFVPGPYPPQQLQIGFSTEWTSL